MKISIIIIFILFFNTFLANSQEIEKVEKQNIRIGNNVPLNVDTINIRINQLNLTQTGIGRIGQYENFGSNGDWLLYKGKERLWQGSLMIGSSKSIVAHETYVDDPNNPFRREHNFFALDTVRLAFGTNADHSTFGKSISPINGGVGVEIESRSFAWKNNPFDKFIILEYKFTNIKTTTIKNFYAGLFLDLDVGDANYNRMNWDSLNFLAYVNDPQKIDSTLAGVKFLNTTNLNSINLKSFYGNCNCTVGYSFWKRSLVYDFLSSGINPNPDSTTVFKYDLNVVVGMGPDSLQPGQSVKYAFALVAGDSLIDIQNSAALAAIKYNGINTEINNISQDIQNLIVYPNPVNEKIEFKFDAINNGNVKIEISDLLGRTIEISNQNLIKNSKNNFEINLFNLPAGMYIYTLSNSKGKQSGKFIKN